MLAGLHAGITINEALKYLGNASLRTTAGSPILLGTTCAGSGQSGPNCETSGTEVTYASSGSGAAFTGENDAANGVGLDGLGEGFGVLGTSGDGDGVHGGSGNANGVSGLVDNSAASGVYGENDGAGYGAAGRANGGIGVLADSTRGTALKVQGVAVFSRSGRVTVPKGKNSVSIAEGGQSAASFVVATVAGNNPGIWVQGAGVPVNHGNITIYLNKVAAKNITVGWLLLN